MTKPPLDLRCYFVTGQGPDVVERARQAAAGGAGVIQVRSKPITARELYALSRACLLYTSPSPRDVEESRMPSSA